MVTPMIASAILNLFTYLKLQRKTNTRTEGSETIANSMDQIIEQKLAMMFNKIVIFFIICFFVQVSCLFLFTLKAPSLSSLFDVLESVILLSDVYSSAKFLFYYNCDMKFKNVFLDVICMRRNFENLIFLSD